MHYLKVQFLNNFGSIVYNRAIEYNRNKRQNFLKVVVNEIIIDQCNQTAR